MESWTVGSVDITRVEDPGFELVLPQDQATVTALRRSPWLRPAFVDDDWSLRVGSSATVIRSGGTVVLVDPFLAFGDEESTAPRLSALRDAGVEAGDVDIVVNTHVDGLGSNLLADGAPAFPQARYLVPAAELDAIRLGSHGDAARGRALLDLHDAGGVEASLGSEVLAPGVALEDAPGHSAGHHVVRVDGGDQQAVIVGHLFLHPAQIADPSVVTGDVDPDRLVATRRAVLDRCAEEDELLLGPLFAAPGGGRVRRDGIGYRLELDRT
jgi:glyoxylase-like metal-dependent hydrolase (beta-lactamase superfamily II)